MTKDETGRLQSLCQRFEGGLLLLLDAVKAGDPKEEIVWRIEEELRLVRAPHPH
jgi:hypothetical protein